MAQLALVLFSVSLFVCLCVFISSRVFQAKLKCAQQAQLLNAFFRLLSASEFLGRRLGNKLYLADESGCARNENATVRV